MRKPFVWGLKLSKMKKTLLFSFLLYTAFGFVVKSQQIPEFNQKMYVDSLNRLYINKDQPIYLWLSTTENRDSARLLQSVDSKEYTNPFYLDTEGLNTVRTPSKVDKKTKQVIIPKSDIIFEVYADGVPPVTSIKFSGAKKHTKNQTTYYGKGLKINLKANDRVSGIKNIYYSINGENYKAYNGEIEFPDEKEVTFKYFAVDNVSNIEELKTKIFHIDVSPPVIEKSIKGNSTLNVLSKDASIVLTSKDELSGVKATYYSIDGKNPVRYSKPLPAYLFSGGDHKLAYFSEDNVGNSSIKDDSEDKEFDFDFVFDNTGPEVELIPEGTCSFKKNGILYLSRDCKISFNASDDYTAVKKIEYAFNTQAKYNSYSIAFALPENNKTQLLYYRAFDELGNRSKIYSQRVITDDKSPITWITYGQPQFFNRDTLFINNKTPISLHAKDVITGVQKTEYNINGNEFTLFTKAFQVEKQGYNSIKFKSTDKVENTEITKESIVVADNSPPEIFARFSIEKIRTKKYNARELPVYPSYSKMYIAATDQHSGTSKIYYSINDKPFLNYAVNNQITKGNVFIKVGLYKVVIKATDKLGNETTKEVLFYTED